MVMNYITLKEVINMTKLVKKNISEDEFNKVRKRIENKIGLNTWWGHNLRKGRIQEMSCHSTKREEYIILYYSIIYLKNGEQKFSIYGMKEVN